MKSKTKDKSLRTCKKCNQEKSASEFYATASGCKPCQIKAVIKNQKEKADYYNKYRSNYSKTNPEKRRAWSTATIKRWEKENGMRWYDYVYAKHKIKMEEDEEYANHHKQKEKEYRLRYKEKHKGKVEEYRRKYYDENRDIFIAKAMIKYWEKQLSEANTDKKNEEG